jgi:methionyl-tRNA formyltransferase
MRIVCLCNNWLGWQVLRWLRQQGEDIAVLVLHPDGRSRHEENIRSEVSGTDCQILTGPQLKDPAILRRIKEAAPEIGVSALFGYIMRREFLDLLPRGCVNIHPAFLPYNRGSYPNVWSIVDKTPAGVTIHLVDEGVDTGDIIVQREVAVSIRDTGSTLYRKLEAASLELFKETWPALRSGSYSRHPQPQGGGTLHRVKDVEQIDEIDLRKSYVAEDLLNLIRARTFPPFPGAYFRHNEKKVYLRLELLEESQLEDIETDGK